MYAIEYIWYYVNIGLGDGSVPSGNKNTDPDLFIVLLRPQCVDESLSTALTHEGKWGTLGKKTNRCATSSLKWDPIWSE